MNHLDLESINRDLYSVLGINSNANTEQIKSKYRELIGIYHPDKVASADQKHLHTKIFQEITMAYKILSNPTHRKIYADNYHNKFDLLKKEYNLRPLDIEPKYDFDEKNFNELFEQENNIDNVISEFDAYTNRTFTTFVQERNQIEFPSIENKLNLPEIKQYIEKFKTAISNTINEHQKDDPEFALFDNIKASLISVLINIIENIDTNHTVIIDFISLSSKLNQNFKNKLDIEWDFIEQIKQDINYSEPEWNKTNQELAPYDLRQDVKLGDYNDILLHNQIIDYL